MRSEPRFDVRSEILALIDKTNDQTMRSLLLLMLGVLEASVAGTEKISKKIDDLLADEARLREVVLNGHDSVHDKHHEWIATQMDRNCAKTCDWAAQKMVEEQAAEESAVEDAKADKRVARDALIRTAVASVVSAAMAALGMLAYLK